MLELEVGFEGAEEGVEADEGGGEVGGCDFDGGDFAGVGVDDGGEEGVWGAGAVLEGDGVGQGWRTRG